MDLENYNIGQKLMQVDSIGRKNFYVVQLNAQHQKILKRIRRETECKGMENDQCLSVRNCSWIITKNGSRRPHCRGNNRSKDKKVNQYAQTSQDIELDPEEFDSLQMVDQFDQSAQAEESRRQRQSAQAEESRRQRQRQIAQAEESRRQRQIAQAEESRRQRQIQSAQAEESRRQRQIAQAEESRRQRQSAQAEESRRQRQLRSPPKYDNSSVDRLAELRALGLNGRVKKQSTAINKFGITINREDVDNF